MIVNLSKWLPTRNFGSSTWLSFYRSVPNNANDIRNQEIKGETQDVYWVYLGDGKPAINKRHPVKSFNTIDNYNFPREYDQNLMRKTIQGSHRHTNKVQIWIGTRLHSPWKVTNTSGFYKVVYDPATDQHNLSAHGDNANVLWNLGFDEGITPSPMAINYK